MNTINLNGEWRVSAVGKNVSVPAMVPGGIHADLLAAGKIKDPYFGKNENDVQWVGTTDWVYARDFQVPAATLLQERVLLRCEGLDTLATILLNGREVARTDNMFRTWEFDVKGILRAGKNRIEIRFASAVNYVVAKSAERPKESPIPQWKQPGSIGGSQYIRKEQCNFGWDWGPCLVTCGIWRPIQIVAFNQARLSGIQVVQDHSVAGKVKLAVALKAERVGTKVALQAEVTVSLKGATVATGVALMKGGNARVELDVKKPELWWPNGLGEQPLYEVAVKLLASDGTVVDSGSKRVGLRTLELDRHPDEWGQSFQFVVNGVPFFAKGANWIPGDAILARMTKQDCARLLNDAAVANMNMMRVWGGGVYEEDAFYDLCDELGICVWQDFMFACSAYPVLDRNFMANVKAELEDNIQRLRHHPSIALWCGNNELEMGLVGEKWYHSEKWKKWTMSWRDYARLFDKLIPETVARLDAGRPYWPASPHTPAPYDRTIHDSPQAGDAHLWDVWHGRKPFEWYRTCKHRFNSEFGFQSFPEPKTVASYTQDGDRNVTSAVMEHHQRSQIGNVAIMQYMCDWFLLPSNFEATLWLSQILQGMAIKYAVEHWRRSMPRGMGTLYWQINDCWPVASWSSIDYHGRWKALHYMARNFYAPVLVSGLEDAAAGTVEVHLTNDRRTAVAGRLSWIVTDAAGKRVTGGKKAVRAKALGDTLVETLALSEVLKKKTAADVLVWLDFEADDGVRSSNLVLFARPKHLKLVDPMISSTVRPLKDGSFAVTLKSKAPALWTWLELAGVDAKWSGNFMNLMPGRAETVQVIPDRTMTVAQVQKALKVKSLIDTSVTV